MCSMRIKSQYLTEWMKITLTACQLILYFLIVTSLFIWGKDGIHKCFIWEVQLLLALVLPICNIRHTIAGFLNIIQLLLKIGSWLMQLLYITYIFYILYFYILQDYRLWQQSSSSSGDPLQHKSLNVEQVEKCFMLHYDKFTNPREQNKDHHCQLQCKKLEVEFIYRMRH